MMNTTKKLYVALMVAVLIVTTMRVSGREPADTTFGCSRDYPDGYCVTEDIKDKDGRARLKRMLPATVVGPKPSLKMSCDKKKFDSMWCCPEGSLQWYDQSKHLSDSDVEGICDQRQPRGPPPGPDGQ